MEGCACKNTHRDFQALISRVKELEQYVLNLESVFLTRKALTELEEEIVEDIHCLTLFFRRFRTCFA